MNSYYDVVILPNDQLNEKVITSSKKLSKKGGFFTLDANKYYPHVSLFMLEITNNHLKEVKKLLATIASKTKILDLEASNYHQSWGYIDVEYTKTERINTLQLQIIEAINSFRDGMREIDEARMFNSKGIALDNFQKYGYKYVGNLLRPHITFTRFDSNCPEAESLLPEATTFTGTFDKLGLFEMGDHDTCVRKIIEFSLQKELYE